jgi:hypothetical protein
LSEEENNAEWTESFVLKQTHFSVNNDNAVTWKYIDLRSRAVGRIANSEHLPKDGQIGPKHVATDVILMSF